MTSQPVVPFSDPPYLCGLPSPIYKETHLKWQKACREFITKNLTENALEWDKEKTLPGSVWDEFVKVNMLIPNLPAPLPVERLKSLGINDILGLKVEDFDAIHGLIYADEMARNGLGGPSASLTTGIAFGVPPILKFGSKELQDRLLPDLLLGKKRACIAITEPDAGSDVANITTEGKKSKDGKYWIITGTKKWITNGIWAHISAMAVRTGGKGPGGISMIAVPLLGQEGVEMRRMTVGGLATSGTTFIELDEVKVPVENTIGQEGAGMKYIMTNFNHERLSIAIGATRQSRVALSTALEYVMKREAFGKPLIDQPVIRNRLARCGAMLESQWAWVEQFSYQMTKLDKATADTELGGLTALCKAQAGIVVNECAQCAILLFGGNGYTASGQGELIERLYRDVPGVRIPGGSEDVMLDLAVRQLVKNYQRKTKELGKGSSKL
ncbi:short-chain specific acyl-CoA dehydrogenase mitochondrial precursor [Pseudovirgaria hyperparasitica]|uniref:Short-chain specific acyl-CoA dehydrogenase mitochondrial n=1 Tax=Pseudovirgaria hyperparasitica TaxID=470096 RepID=A0A6A6WGS8_9PEZI|nr:short-chain specific acyl-CoA dehydrogenase mitochondrial precursor [Pseudovirgaria hyperparasitica]KAF2762018.1 short-chain specific acyl-CoA dehydrogenase mitochondrial precursor [Pseudovirgaria hyperparasitica]